MLGRAVGVEVRGDQLGPVHHHPDRRLHHLVVDGPTLADHDVVGIVVHDRVAVFMEGVEQASFADHIGGATRLLRSQKSGRGHRAGEDVRFRDLDPQPVQFGDHVTTVPLAVVGKKEKGQVEVKQVADKAVCSRDEFAAAVDDPVHVDQESMGGRRGKGDRVGGINRHRKAPTRGCAAASGWEPSGRGSGSDRHGAAWRARLSISGGCRLSQPTWPHRWGR